MRIAIPYGKRTTGVEIEDRNLAGVIAPNEVPSYNEKEVVLASLERPVNSLPFEKFLESSKNILFIVNDLTRPTPTKRVLDFIYEKIKDKKFSFLVAVGSHRSPTNQDFDFIFGEYYEKFKDRIFAHDSKDDKQLIFIGKTARGTEVYINKTVENFDRIVIIGSIEPHYFAGYTGGRKAFLPGIAGYKTITQNHSFALEKDAKVLSLVGNPIHEDMIEASKLILEKIKIPVFSINIVLDRNHRIYSCTAGALNESFFEGVKEVANVFLVRVKEKADIVVSVALPPMDINLYQAEKALHNGKLALKKNGILILVAECRGGIGDKIYYEQLGSSKTPHEALEKIKKEYVLSSHKVGKLAEIASRAQIWVVSRLEHETLSDTFIKGFNNLQAAINEALKQKGENAKILFLMDGSLTVPKVK